jgi:hypothetical protein
LVEVHVLPERYRIVATWWPLNLLSNVCMRLLFFIFSFFSYPSFLLFFCLVHVLTFSVVCPLLFFLRPLPGNWVLGYFQRRRTEMFTPICLFFCIFLQVFAHFWLVYPFLSFS